MNRTNQLIGIALILALTSGCDDERTVRVATEAAERQAVQNQEMARLNRDSIKLHRDIQAERGTLNESWNDLEVQRRQVASKRRTDSFLTTATQGLGLLMVVALSLAVIWLALNGATQETGNDPLITELLLDELDPSELPVLPSQATEKFPVRHLSVDDGEPSSLDPVAE